MLSALWLLATAAGASGPRFVTGPPFFTGSSGQPIGWKQARLLYFTDPGGLSANLNHAASDALVAAAVGVWNIPQASITVAQGGSLAEHVSGANTYLDTNGMEFPADVMAANAVAAPIAIVYDTDGSVTDTLLGAGSSLPSACRTNAVTSTVDSFDPAGYILHAVIVLNGRCTVPTANTTAAALQLDVQYKLMRAFGRVLGLAWSQTNDNVFTGSPVPTNNQALHWPIMHPIDIICGLYSYQCLPSPFVLRPDDIASMVMLYPNQPGSNEPAGKQDSLNNASAAQGYVTFPDGQGMADVNVLLARSAPGSAAPESWIEVSGVTGYAQRRGAGSPFLAAGTDALSSMGSPGGNPQGFYNIAYVPVLGTSRWDDLVASTEAVNSLYNGAFTLGPYGPGVAAPAGSAPAAQTGFVESEYSTAFFEFPIADAPQGCGTGTDGSADAPAPLPSTGWWTATLCGYGHASSMSLLVKPGRTLTIEATALDVNGLATTSKAMPVIGLFAPSDGAAALPSLGVTPSAFNAVAVGTTSLSAATGTLTSLRVGVADQRGEDRPDFNYQGRVFYADEAAPAQVSAAGGTLTITGTGFRTGNAVLVNGVAGTVQSWSTNKLVVLTPTLAASAASAGTPVDVEVLDRGTGATSTLMGALVYTAAPGNGMILVSAPAGSVPTGVAATPVFAVRVVKADGVTPVAGANVVFAVQAGSAVFAACGASTCTVTTDSTGLAQTAVTPAAEGVLTFEAADGALQQVVSVTAVTPAASMQILAAPAGVQTVGTQAQTPLVVRVFGAGDSSGLPNHLVTFSVPVGSATWSGCSVATCSAVTNGAGIVYLYVTPTAAGPVTVEATADGVSQQAILTAVAVLDSLSVTAYPANPAYVNESAGGFAVQLQRPDGSGEYGERVTFSGPASIVFSACQSNVCTMNTDGNGNVGTAVVPSQTGTYTVQAAYGSLVVSASLTVGTRSLSFRILSMPASPSTVGQVAATPFSAQLIGLDGVTPVSGAAMTLGGATASVRLAVCGGGTCNVTSDVNGVVSSPVTPLLPGVITLSVAYPALVKTATFTAVTASDSMQVLAQPGTGTVFTGVEQTFRVRLVGPDGSTPDAGKAVVFTVTSGSVAFAGCASACSVTTDANGVATVQGSASAAGAVSVQAAYGAVAQTMSFTASVPPDVLRLVTAPANGSLTGAVNPSLFAVQVFGPDGVTPAPGRAVTFTVTAGAAGFGACAAAYCTVYTDGAGRASTSVTANSSGTVGLLATEGTATVAASFTAVANFDVLRVVSAPASGGYVGTASAPFALRVLEADGVTPAAGRSVVLSVTAGSAGFAACAGAATCVLVADANGVVSSAVTPDAAGSITLQAADGTVLAMVVFTAQAVPDVLRVIAKPASGGVVGVINSSGLIVQVLLPDGVTAAVGRSVQLAVVAGSASLGACAAAASCGVTTDSSGRIATTVTPLASGTVTLQVTDGAASATASFTVAGQPDVLRVVLVPASGGFVGTVGAPVFQVAVFEGDGVTPAAGRSVAISVAAGSAGFAACGGATSCTLVSDASGLASSAVTPLSAGAITLQVAEGSVSVTASFTAVARPDVVRVMSVPADGSLVGDVAVASFSVRVLAGDGVTAAAGRSAVLSAGGAMLTACGAASCMVATDANGLAASGVKPLAAGTVTLGAADGAVTASASFVAVNKPNLLQLVSAPASGAWVGVADAPAFAVRLVMADGVTPVVGATVALGVTAGTASFAACGAASCAVTTDATGMASSGVTALAAGTVTVQASVGTLTQSVSFAAQVRADVLKLVSAPADGSLVGDTAATAFAVQVFAGDGVTPGAGRSVTLRVSGGSARLAACGAASCVLTADAQGVVSSGVVPLTAGEVTLQAADAGITVAAAFRAEGKPDVLRLAEAPASTVFVGDSTSITVQVLLADGVTPVAGRSVSFALTAGSAQWTACAGAAVCTGVTDGAGLVSMQVTPAAGGLVGFAASETAGTGNTVSGSFTAVARADMLAMVTAPGTAVQQGAASTAGFAVRLTQADGVTPVSGVAIVFSIVGRGAGMVQFAACGASVCPVVTGPDGTASTGVTGTVAGALTLVATPDAGTGAGAVSVPFQVVANAYSLDALQPGTYVAEGVGFGMELDALASENGNAAVGQAVSWMAGAAMTLSAASSATDAKGATAMEAQLGPLAAGQTASAEACAFAAVSPQVCAAFRATGVGASQFALVLASGGAQAVSGGAALATVAAQVTDGAGDPVAGAPVTVYQTVTALTEPCPPTGRCPAQPVLRSKVTVMTSDANGLVTLAPLTVDGVATQTNLVFSAGTQGYLTTVLARQP